MITQKRFILGLVSSLMLTPACWAQPAVPTVAVPTTAPANLWSFLLPNAEQKANCKTCFCNSPLGQLTSGAMGPLSAFSGGMVANRCAQNAINNAILNNPSTSSEGAAARIKKDEADAKARREAVRYLGTVDCNYWPEATEALVKSLRKDPNECVRFEAALSLRNGCCCNEKTVKALEHCVAGNDKDGAPIERSDRVRAAAADALARCPLLQIEAGEKNGDIKKTEAVDPAKYYDQVGQMSREKVAASARGVLVGLQQANRDPSSSTVPPIYQRSGSLAGIVAHSFAPTNHAPLPVVTNAQNTTKPLSVYEAIAARNAKQEYIVPARQEYVIPARAEFRNAPSPNLMPPARTELRIPAKADVVAPTKAEIVAPFKVEVVAPVTAPAPSARDAGPTIIQIDVEPTLPPITTTPRRTTGYVTMAPTRP